ncbi:MAG: hypothetical protein ACTSPY_15025 [Candidatus Helarchaeota archaeon]
MILPFSIRALTTAASFDPLVPIPWGNSVNITIYYRVSDAQTLYHQGEFISSATVSVTDPSSWTLNNNYSISELSSSYRLTVFNDTVNQIGNYLVNISFTSPSGIYTNATLENVPFRIRRLKTTINFDPIPTIPWGNNCTIFVYYQVQDSESDYHDGEFLAYQTLSITNPGWTLGVNYTYTAYATNYTIEINNETINTIGSYSISVVINTTNNVYENGSFVGIPFTVRELTTTITYNPVAAAPYGENVTITLFYIVSDSESWYHNGEFIGNSPLEITSPAWTEGVDFEYVANPTNYTLEINNASILTIGVHYIDVKFSSISGIYKNATFYNIPFTIRALTTRITYTAVPDTPYGDNVSIYIVYEVSDPQSQWYNGEFITGGSVAVTSPSGWAVGTNYTYSENPTNYTLNIGNTTVNQIGSYQVTVQMTPNSSIYATATLADIPFTIRRLITGLSYDAVADTPFGNNVTIQVYMIVNDPESDWWDGKPVPVNGWVVQNSSYTFVQHIDYTYTELVQGTYQLSLSNETIANKVSSYQISVMGIADPNLYSNATIPALPFKVRKLITRLTYDPVYDIPFGDSANIVVYYEVSDVQSWYHNGEVVAITNFTIRNSTTQFVYNVHYNYTDMGSYYNIMIINDTVLTSIGGYSINVTAYPLQSDIYIKANLPSIPFNVRQAYTNHTILIGNESLPAVSGWPWGDNITVRITYYDIDHDSPISNGIIEVAGELVYDNDNYTVTTFGNGTFIIDISGVAGEHGQVYLFDINLYVAEGTHVNNTFIISVSFRKSIANFMIHQEPEGDVSWGDNITLLFSFNNSEAEGEPGIPGANINVSVSTTTLLNGWSTSDIKRAGNFTFYEVTGMGDGVWNFTMNTTILPILPYQEITLKIHITGSAIYTISAYYNKYVTVIAIPTESTRGSYDRVTYAEEASSFNITVKVEDTDHNVWLENNSYAPGGSIGQYNNIRFGIQMPTYNTTYYGNTWYWGNITVDTSNQNIGEYRFSFSFNGSEVDELDNFQIIFTIYGDHIKNSSVSFLIDLIIKTHPTNITANYTVASSQVIGTLYEFPSIATEYYWGQIIDVWFYWWDEKSSANNPGIITGVSKTTDLQVRLYEGGSVNYSTWFSTAYWELNNTYLETTPANDTLIGLFRIRIDTSQIYREFTGNFRLHIHINASEYNRIYLTSELNVSFYIRPVRVNLTLVDPSIIATPWGDQCIFTVNYTDYDRGNIGIIALLSDIYRNVVGINASNQPQINVFPSGDIGIYQVRIDTSLLDIGIHILNLTFVKLNYETISVNFTFEVRLIRTKIVFYDWESSDLDDIYNISANSMAMRYRHTGLIKFYYQDNETYTNYDYIHSNLGNLRLASYTLLNWTGIFNLSGDVSRGRYEINVTCLPTVNVGIYNLRIQANLSHYEVSYLNITVEILPARTSIVSPFKGAYNIYQFFSVQVPVSVMNEFGEPIDGVLNYYLNSTTGGQYKIGSVNVIGGVAIVTLDSVQLDVNTLYYLVLEFTPTSGNYASTNNYGYQSTMSVNPIWEHPLFIAAMIAIVGVAAVVAYRQIKWWMKPYQIKEIIKGTKLIKKGKAEATTPVVKSREELFIEMFEPSWVSLGLKPPKLVDPEIVAFASELSAILRTRITTPEAETLINQLRSMSELEGEHRLAEMNVPPEASKRLLTIIGVIKKEKVEILEFARLLSEIKGTEIDYNQAQEVLTNIKQMTPRDADMYLEAMVIPAEDRIRLLEMAGIPIPKHLKTQQRPFLPVGEEEKVEEVKKPKKKKEEKEKSMSIDQIKEELDKIPGLSEEEKKVLIDDLKNLSLKEQKDILKSLK